MNRSETVAPVLILTIGNPSRGDDALGSALFDLLKEHQHRTGKMVQVDLFTDFQLQIEHAVDLRQRHTVLFVDASVSCSPPFELKELRAERDDSFTTHAMSPASVLSVYQKIYKCEPPPAYLLEIRAHEFGLGLPLSKKASSNLQQAFHYVVDSWEPAKG